MGRTEQWKKRAKKLLEEVDALYLAGKDPRTPWYAKLVAFAVLGYALSPIDLIPDFIPVLGYLDDLLLLPLGIFLATKLIPTALWEECRERAKERSIGARPKSWIFAIVILLFWMALALAAFRYFY